MLRQDAYDLMDLLLDKADQPYFIDSEKDMFLMQSVVSFINNHYAMYGQRQVSRDALQSFVISSSGINLTDYVHILNCTVGSKSVKIVSEEEFSDSQTTSDPFNKASNSNIKGTVRNNTLELTTSDTGVNVVYIQMPSIDDVFPILSEGNFAELHQREVIDIAIRKMTGNIESPNVQYQQIEAEQSKSI